MTDDTMSSPAPKDEISRVELLLTVARTKGSLLSAKEIEELTDLLPAGSDLESIWDKIPHLDSHYLLQAGQLIEKQAGGSKTSLETLLESSQRRARAEKYIECAHEFSLLSGTRWVRVLSVAGSTSYMNARANDDIDIFCVTEKDSLWIYLTKALLLARVFGLVRSWSPRFCFSCVLDEEYARKLFASPNDALFARDALTAQILQGRLFYEDLLRSGQWLSEYFPKLRRLKKTPTANAPQEIGITRPTSLRRALNHFMFLTVGNYVRLKSSLLNRRLRKAGRHDALFTLESGRDHCIFESQSYQKLRRIYSGFTRYSNQSQSYKIEKVGAAR
jgi:hypothetical protein